MGEFAVQRKFVFDETLLNVHLNSAAIKRKAKQIQELAQLCNENERIRDLLLAVNCIDLTTLAGDDTKSNVTRLCFRAGKPLSEPIVKKLNERGFQSVTTGAVCVYPSRVGDCFESFGRFKTNLPIASVVTGFPAGQGEHESTLSEIRYACSLGATEIDIVINRTLVLTGQWRNLFQQIRDIVLVCQETKAHLKVIHSYGELATLDNIYKSSMVAMMAGANFIKTSTGKETINAKLVYGLVMARSIRDFNRHSGLKVGLKPAGGLKSAQDAIEWVTLVRRELGPEWCTNKLFRIGASSMLANIEKELWTITQPKCIPQVLSF